MAKKDVYIDADHILFSVCKSKTYDSGFEEYGEGEYEDFGQSWENNMDMTQYQNHFKAIVEDYVTTAQVDSICYNWELGDIHVIMSDKSNFRYKLYPEYKALRPQQDEIFKKLQKWARKTYRFEKDTEADDVVAYYVRKGALGFTTDKDLFKGVAGKWFNCHYMHKNWLTTSHEEAEDFFKCQILGGDRVDGIPSIPNVAIVTAKKLMNKHGDSYEDIVKIFELHGFDREYMMTMARLVSMSQWTPKHGVRLWKGKKL